MEHSYLEPLTENERMLLDAYDLVRHYEREASRLKAEEARRRLEEADVRYRAKLREREGGGKDDDVVVENEGGEDDDDDGDDDDKDDSRGVARERGRNADSDDDDRGGGGGRRDTGGVNKDDDDDEFAEEEEDAAIVERRRRREVEISRLRREVDAANLARGRREAETEEARRKEEAMRRDLLGIANGNDGDDNNAAGEDGRRKRRHPTGDDDDDDDETEGDDDDEGGYRVGKMAQPTTKLIRKKRRSDDDGAGTSNAAAISLIANIAGGDATPVHDFSKRLGMGTTSSDGTVLFPPPDGDDRRRLPWCPPDTPRDFVDGCMELELSDVDPASGDGGGSSLETAGNNTVAIKFHTPKDSSRFSVNIATPDGRDGRYDDVLFHFNPRQFQRGGHLVLNDKTEKMWGNDVSVPLSTLPVMFGVDSCTLIVQINEEGFDVFVEGVHCARLEHRRALSPALDDGGGRRRRPSLILQFPSSDDYGNPENWLVHRVWWGRKRSMVDPEKLDGVAGVNIYSAVHPRRLFVSGLSKLLTDPEVDLRRAELERAFRKYGGPTGAVAVSLQKNSTFAFVDVATEGQADLALLEMASSGRYRVNKARRSRHEALLEERAARESAEGGGSSSAKAKEAVDWD
jgi:hypothetical protein